MNPKEYIESGILEAYVLQELDERERRLVESQLMSDEEVRKELKAIELTVERLIAKARRQPSQQLRERLFASQQIGLGARTSNVLMWKYATAASLLMAIATATLSYIFWSNWKRTENDLAERISLTQRMAENLNQVNERIDKIEHDLTIYDNPLFTRVIMKGTSNAPSALASVFWNKSTQEVFLSIQNLKVLTQENQYQLWAIVDGKPVDMGIIENVQPGLLKMNRTARASAFAITIEPRGGKSSPSLETMQVMGST